MTTWDIQQARELYNITHWGGHYFDINEQGCVVARPNRHQDEQQLDMHKLAHEIRAMGLSWPVLVRFTDVLQNRVEKLCSSFQHAITEESYQGDYTAVYPIKVNQQRTVVEHLLATKAAKIGLEAGSKPELMAVLAMADQNGGTIVCNGYKDREYIRLALMGQRLGHRVYIVIEKLSELNIVLDESKKMDVKPLLGLRVRLSSIGRGKWQNTGGEKSKFGLSATHVLSVVDRLVAANALDCLQLVHCHLGSQLANIRDIQVGLREVAFYFAELSRLGAPINKVDVGGGLGVDYEGTRSRSYCSMNYSVQEYANDVVKALADVCEATGYPHPGIITESGRAMTAHHAVLLTNVIDTEEHADVVPTSPADSDARVLHSLWETYEQISARSALEAYHDAAHWLNEAQTLFNHGILDLNGRARAEQLYIAICKKVLPLLEVSSRSHRETLDELTDKLAAKYFCNLSVFQSIPDVWAIDQIFPIIPLHRHNERPSLRATIQDLTCDSDGVVKQYVDGQSVETTLPVHDVKKHEPYLIGIFMVGAYQEILGDMHNLFGDTHSINVEFNDAGEYQLVEPERGDRVDEVLRFVHFDPEILMQKYHEKLNAVNLDDATRKQYLSELEDGLSGYTYLED